MNMPSAVVAAGLDAELAFGVVEQLLAAEQLAGDVGADVHARTCRRARDA
ncbi:MAG: hypothetical protein V9E94_20610 [Microthrixaceae bacterium]